MDIRTVRPMNDPLKPSSIDKHFKDLKKDIFPLIEKREDENPAIREYMARTNLQRKSYYEYLYKILSVIFENNNSFTYDDIVMFFSNIDEGKILHHINFLIYHGCLKRHDKTEKKYYDDFMDIQFRRKDNYLYRAGTIKMKKEEFRRFYIQRKKLDPNDLMINDLVEERFKKFVDRIFKEDDFVIYTLTQKGQKLLYYLTSMYALFGVSFDELGFTNSVEDMKNKFKELGLDPKYYEQF